MLKKNKCAIKMLYFTEVASETFVTDESVAIRDLGVPREPVGLDHIAPRDVIKTETGKYLKSSLN